MSLATASQSATLRLLPAAILLPVLLASALTLAPGGQPGTRTVVGVHAAPVLM